MQGFVSSRERASFALIALSIVGLACSILDPYGLRWMGVGWVGLAVAAALWLNRLEPLLVGAVDGSADLTQRR